MTQYLLGIYQPDGDPPPAEVLEPIMRDVEAVNAELRAAGAWVFAERDFLRRRRSLTRPPGPGPPGSTAGDPAGR